MTMIALLCFVGIAFGLAWYLVKHDRGAKEPVSMLWAAFGFGFVAAVLASLVNSISTSGALEALITQSNIEPSLIYLLLASIMVGITEEVAKAIPLALFIIKKSYFNEHTDGVIYFAISGLCFSLIENLSYTLTFGGGTGLTRIIVAPFLHSGLTGIFGFYLARYKITGRSKGMVSLALCSVILLHTLYDFGLFSRIPVLTVVSLMVAALINVGLFLYYAYATKLDQGLGLSAIGNNKYCRHCGQPNPKRNLYCARCGQRT